MAHHPLLLTDMMSRLDFDAVISGNRQLEEGGLGTLHGMNDNTVEGVRITV